MNKNCLLKYILIGGFSSALAVLPVRAISGEKFSELRTKAEAGDGGAQYDLALAYADPQASHANILEAYVWFTLAAENGAPGKAYMIVANQMTAQQLVDGKKLLEQRRSDLAAHRTTAALSEPDNTAIKAELAKAGADLAAAKLEAEQLKTELDKIHQSALEKLRSERDDLAATVAKYTNEISTLRATAANYEGECNALKQQIADAGNASKESMAAFEADLASTKARLKTVEDDLARSESGRKELGVENQRLTKQSKETTAALAGKLAETEKKLDEARAELRGVQGRLAEAVAQSAKTEKDIAALRTANAELGGQVKKVTAEKDKALAQSGKSANEAREQMESLTARLKKMEQALSKSTSEREALVAENTKELAVLKTASAKLEKERNTLKQQLDKTGGTAKETGAELTATKARLKAVEGELAKAEAARKSLDSENQRLTKLNKESATALTGKLSDYEKKLTEAKTELQKAQTRLAEAAAQSTKTENEVATLRTTNNELGNQIQKLVIEKDRALAQSVKASDEARERIEALNQKIKTIETSAAIVTAINVDLAKEIADMKAAHLATMREQLHRAQSQLASIANENAELKQRLSTKTPDATVLTDGKKLSASVDVP